ncbi:MAG TPA: [FeFe] hydrogenase H-cluster radical SAM maturase HydG, partial [Candidatus Omnitrophota bacterium]|nr:[FeFe] hydrogenase H-cluster radical SAM maturase HydG [Candidatus Omnitrophota bacterium]
MDATLENKRWQDTVIRAEENASYMAGDEDFIDDRKISELLSSRHLPDGARIRDIIQKSRSIQTLLPQEAADLIAVRDPGLWEEIFSAAADIKRAVYDNRV